jgi:hypothetical protein
MTLDCRYCGQPARLVSGDQIYPHRPDLARLKFWRCSPCDAWVGVHQGTDNALGILAKAELRRLKSRVHAAFDPIWLAEDKDRRMKRSEAYRWLAEGLGIPEEECHIGMFDEDRCNAALSFLAEDSE